MAAPVKGDLRKRAKRYAHVWRARHAVQMGVGIWQGNFFAPARANKIWGASWRSCRLFWVAEIAYMAYSCIKLPSTAPHPYDFGMCVCVRERREG